MRWRPKIVGLFLCVWSVLGSSEEVEFFEKRVRPVLAEHCYECHSIEAKKAKGNLRLDSKEAILKGGEAGLAIVPGKPEESLLITAIRYMDKDLQMPPAKNGQSRKLSEGAIADIVAWVKRGAAMPDAVGSKDRGDDLSHWAFQAPRPQELPRVNGQSWVKNGVDAFILAKLEANHLKPAPRADNRTLIRRLSFDLTGLPPTPDEVDAFLKDKSGNAYKNLVERLLASPRYGERWGRRWLDVARYADTKGYVYDREERFFAHAWAYRDWVVRAFNDDMPYDRFLKLQIAADQVAEKPADLAAMGFITGGRRFIGIQREIIDDRIDVVTRGTMGLTVACARCHDHKYDPIPTRDYYSLYGVFESSTESLVSLGSEPTDEEYLKRVKKFREMMAKRREEAGARLRERVEEYLAAQLELEKYPEEGFDQILSEKDVIPASVRRWRDYLHRIKDKDDPIFGPWFGKRPSNINPEVARAFETPVKDQREAAARYGKLFKETKDPELVKFLNDPKSPTVAPDTGIINNDQFFPTSVCEELWRLQGDIDRWLIKEAAAPAQAMVMRDREPERNPRIFIRGNPARQGEEVPRQFLKVAAGKDRKPFSRGSGRLELAEAIASPDNPLTARVMVNRIWQDHFGAGLVKTASDFGLRAEKPSHPELLDWLALEFIKSGWSIKAVHRLILFSATYQQTSLDALPISDPENRLLSQFPRSRLDFEQMRDAMLAASGELEANIGGKATALFSEANKRRTIYSLVDRQFLAGTFRVFDFANPDIHVGQRHLTTVPQQALFFMNHSFVAERARALAKSTNGSPRERIERLYRQVYQRAPTRTELAAGLSFIASAGKDTPPPPPKPVPTPWQYGWGEYDPETKRTKSFNALPHFTGKAWQGGENFPDGKLGWVQLTAEGGHPGNDLQHASIRRWVAPMDGTITISGELKHEAEVSDGVRAFIISSRHGELKTATAHHSKVEMSAANVEVKQGDTIDFIVDILKELNTDQYVWSPAITTGAGTWEAKKDFRGPTPKAMEPLQPWAQYAQALLLANEFCFVD